MRKAYKFRLYPSRKQAEFLDHELTAARRLYNAALEQRRIAWKRRGLSLGYLDQAGDLKGLGASGACTPVNYSACQDVLRRLDKAFRAFFRRLKAGGKPGFPRFKSKDRYDSLTFPSYGDGCRIRVNGKLYLQGIGEIRVKWHRQVAGKIKTVTVRRRGGRWHVCFSVEYEPRSLPQVDADVGIDVGLDHFAALSTGELIANPRWYASAQKRLRRAQRKVSRCVKGSNGRRNAVRELQRIHEHVANQRHVQRHVCQAGPRCGLAFLPAGTHRQSGRSWAAGGGSEPGRNEPALHHRVRQAGPVMDCAIPDPTATSPWRQLRAARVVKTSTPPPCLAACQSGNRLMRPGLR